MDPQDELLALIKRLVGERVRPEHQEQFVQVVTLTVAQLMSTPRFLNELVVVAQLRQQVARLTNENLILKQVLTDQSRRPPPKKAPGPRKRAAPKSQAKAFQAGVRDVTRRR